MTPPKGNSGFIKFRYTLLILFFSFCGNAKSDVINISVMDNVFTPSDVTANVGDVIRWTWAGSRTHTTTCDGVFPGTILPAGAAPWDFLLSSGAPVFEYELLVEGTYDYACLFHSPDMVGTIHAEKPLPVELTDFVATTIKNEVILDWGTGGEINNEKFEIQRINVKDITTDDPDNLPYKIIGVLTGNGTSNHPHRYKFIDRNLSTGVYLYRLKQVDYNSNYIYHLLKDEVVIGIPDKFNLSQNYPNPFNPVTRINYQIPVDGFVTISLFDVSGRFVSTIVNTNTSAGYHTSVVDGTGLSSGVYFYKIDFKSANVSESSVKRMMLVK